MADVLYDLINAFFSFVLSVFFREIRSRGSQNIPPSGPVIFVVAPHHNQFVDPLVLMKTSARRIRFLIAQKSMARAFVGRLARAIGSIGVNRTQDLAVKAHGKLVLLDPVNAPDTLCAAEGANFGPEGAALMPGDLIFLARSTSDVPLVVEAVVNAHTVRLARAVTEPEAVALLDPMSACAGLAWRVARSRMPGENGAVYAQVHEKLRKGACIGIFPEGGSHDRSELLPFKPGFAIMALGAMVASPGLDVKLVPVGLSYFHAHRFRSRAVVEYGTPITVPRKLVDQYATGGPERRKACQALLEVVHSAVSSVTVTAPDYGTLMVVQAVRRLYRPKNHKLTMVQKLELTRRLVKGYMQYKDDPRVQYLEKRVHYYNKQLLYYGLQDHQVGQTAIVGARALGLLFYRLIMLSIMAAIALPGTVINIPIAIAASKISKKKAKEALAASAVKIEGRDVLATWKLMVALVLVPIVYSFYTFMSWATVRFVFKAGPPATVFVPLGVMFGLPYISLIAISFGEVGADIYRSLAPLTCSILPSRWGPSETLRQMRGELIRDVNDIINELGPTLFPDFQTFFLKDTEIPSSQQSAIGLKRVSSWVSSWLVPAEYDGLGTDGTATTAMAGGSTLSLSSAYDLTRFFVSGSSTLIGGSGITLSGECVAVNEFAGANDCSSLHESEIHGGVRRREGLGVGVGQVGALESDGAAEPSSLGLSVGYQLESVIARAPLLTGATHQHHHATQHRHPNDDNNGAETKIEESKRVRCDVVASANSRSTGISGSQIIGIRSNRLPRSLLNIRVSDDDCGGGGGSCGAIVGGESPGESQSQILGEVNNGFKHHLGDEQAHRSATLAPLMINEKLRLQPRASS